MNVHAQGHKAMMPVRVEPAAPRSRVKHSTTEPLPSLYSVINIFDVLCYYNIQWAVIIILDGLFFL